MHAFKAAEQSTDPWLSFAYRKLNDRVQFRFFAELQQRLTDDIERVLRDAPANTFAVFHFPLPHKPFLFEADGSLRSHAAGLFDNTAANYQNNLRQLDRVVGRFVSTLHNADKYDDAMIILTSDHTWRHDPDVKRSMTDDELTHVPLIVKLPGAMHVGDQVSEMSTAEITSLIAAGLDGNEAVAAFLQSREASESPALARRESEVRP
jgi:arylsulfatase A-like enzyme